MTVAPLKTEICPSAIEVNFIIASMICQGALCGLDPSLKGRVKYGKLACREYRFMPREKEDNPRKQIGWMRAVEISLLVAIFIVLMLVLIPSWLIALFDNRLGLAPALRDIIVSGWFFVWLALILGLLFSLQRRNYI